MCNFEFKGDASKELLPDSTIEDLVEQVFKGTDLRSIPIKIIPIVKHYGFSVFRASMPDTESGYIMVSNKTIEPFGSKKVIVYNFNHSKRRNRFTVAHELAHYIFHTKEEIYAHRDSSNSGNSRVEEINANRFASALLMPKNEVLSFVKEVKNDFLTAIPSDYIYYVSEKFNVSESAAEIRLKKLGVII